MQKVLKLFPALDITVERAKAALDELLAGMKW
jgi:hypothetical protein